jgi:hypothetical protein
MSSSASTARLQLGRIHPRHGQNNELRDESDKRLPGASEDSAELLPRQVQRHGEHEKATMTATTMPTVGLKLNDT